MLTSSAAGRETGLDWMRFARFARRCRRVRVGFAREITLPAEGAVRGRRGSPIPPAPAKRDPELVETGEHGLLSMATVERRSTPQHTILEVRGVERVSFMSRLKYDEGGFEDFNNSKPLLVDVGVMVWRGGRIVTKSHTRSRPQPLW